MGTLRGGDVFNLGFKRVAVGIHCVVISVPCEERGWGACCLSLFADLQYSRYFVPLTFMAWNLCPSPCWTSLSQSVIPGPKASMSPGNLLAMQILGPVPPLLNQTLWA